LKEFYVKYAKSSNKSYLIFNQDENEFIEWNRIWIPRIKNIHLSFCQKANFDIFNYSIIVLSKTDNEFMLMMALSFQCKIMNIFKLT
jgi:hypothetical protein